MNLHASYTPTIPTLALLLFAPACSLNTFGIDITAGTSGGITTVSSFATSDESPATTEESSSTEPTMPTGESTTASETYNVHDTEASSGTDTSSGTEASTGTSGETSTDAGGDTSTGGDESSDTSTGEPQTSGESSTGAPALCDDACGGATPVCDPETDTCVGCLENADCAVDQPICNAEHSCEPCDDHSQCSAGACDLEGGQCMPDSCVYYVQTGLANCDDGADGKTPVTPLCSLTKAIALLQPGKPCTIKLGEGGYGGLNIIPEGNYSVAIVPYADHKPQLSSPALKVQAGNKVYMRDLEIVVFGYPGVGLECRHADLWLDRLRIFGAQNGQHSAMHADDCRAHVRQSIITGMFSGGIDFEGEDVETAQLWLENSYLTKIAYTSFGAIRLQGAVKASLLYTTAAEAAGQVPMINCLAGFSGSVDVRNSAIAGIAPRFGAACSPEVKHSYDSTNNGNLFEPTQDGQYKAKAGGSLKDIAEWIKATDPEVDQDGTPRPTENFGQDYAGADRP